MSSRNPVLILQLRPEDVTSDSEYACVLKHGGLRAEDTCRMRIERNGIPGDLDLDDYSAIIVGGSPFDLSTPEDSKLPIQIGIETDFRRLLKQVVDRDFPFLGACSGNGLLGSYLGTRISRKYGEPVGCVTLDITDQGRQDPLLEGFPKQIDVLLGHKEAADAVPAGATLLITGRDCPVQMFRVGQNVYATQFHPEADSAELMLRIETYRNHGYFEPHQAEELKERVRHKSVPYAHQIIRRFVERYYG